MSGSLLVVDDNEMNRDMLSRRLQHLELDVVTARNGREALNLLVERTFDLVLLDIEMPEMDGVTVLRLLRKTHPMTALPVIMVTARNQSEDVVQALDDGANDYITKPIDFAVLRARVATQLALKQANDQVRTLAAQLEARNQVIRQIFGRYVDNGVVDTLLDSPEALRLGGEHREVSLLFADLRGFTAVLERLLPQQGVTLLNRYLRAMIDTINKHGGIVDELLGDGVMAFFMDQPDDAGRTRRALACGLEMQSAVERVSQVNQAEGLPTVRLGVGIHSGEVVMGNIGSETRSKYSVVGRHVNLASRIESYSSGGQVMISEAVLEEVGAIVRIDGRMNVHPKGMDQPITIYDVGGIGPPFGIFLPKAGHVPQPLARAIPIRYTTVSDKRREQRSFRGELVGLSAGAGEMRVIDDRRTLAAFSDLRIELEGETNGPAFLYAKVVGQQDGSNHYSLRFTCVSPEMLSALARLTGRSGT
jgi:class 3 adenylate cyclase